MSKDPFNFNTILILFCTEKIVVVIEKEGLIFYLWSFEGAENIITEMSMFLLLPYFNFCVRYQKRAHSFGSCSVPHYKIFCLIYSNLDFFFVMLTCKIQHFAILQKNKYICYELYTRSLCCYLKSFVQKVKCTKIQTHARISEMRNCN